MSYNPFNVKPEPIGKLMGSISINTDYISQSTSPINMSSNMSNILPNKSPNKLSNKLPDTVSRGYIPESLDPPNTDSFPIMSSDQNYTNILPYETDTKPITYQDPHTDNDDCIPWSVCVISIIFFVFLTCCIFYNIYIIYWQTDQNYQYDISQLNTISQNKLQKQEQEQVQEQEQEQEQKQ